MVLLLQDIYCFVLPFILKWLVAALVVSVLVDLFSKLNELGDKARVHIYQRIRIMTREAFQHYWNKAPSNADMLLLMFRLTRKRKSLKLLSSFIRHIPAFTTQHSIARHSTTVSLQCFGLSISWTVGVSLNAVNTAYLVTGNACLGVFST